MRERSFVGFVVFTLVTAVVLGLLQWVFRKGPNRPRTLREFATDLFYWCLTPFATRAVTRLVTGALVVMLAIALGFGRGESGAMSMVTAIQERSPIYRLPIAVQLLTGFMLADFLAYWEHRAFHESMLWRFHAVHHSSKTLDWLAATRLHPLNDLVGKLVITAPLIFCGFDIKVLAGVAPLLTLHALFIHADVPWSFGPLRYVISSPRFHRWHHTSQEEGLDKNFAGLFPIWDLIFGTFYMPARAPERFGVLDLVPEGLLGQLAWPFRVKAPSLEKSVTTSEPSESSGITG